MKQILNRASVVLAFVLMFFSLSAFATNLYEIGVNDGKQICKDNPTACGITVNPDTTTQADKDYCKKNPNDCGITVNPDTTTQADKDYCKKNPSDCGITVNPDTTTQADKDYCKKNPSDCGITFTDTNGSRDDGIIFCQQNPNACGLSRPDPNAITEAGKNAGKQECQNNIQNCVQESPTAMGILKSYEDKVTQTAKEEGKEEGKKECKEKPEECFKKININPENEEVPEDFCENKTKNCYSPKYGLYLNAVNATAEPPVDATGNVSTILTDIKLDLLVNGTDAANFNDTDTVLFTIKLKDLLSKIEEEKKRKEEAAKAQEANNTTEPTNTENNVKKAVITVEEQKQLITSNNTIETAKPTIETAKTIDYYPSTVISSSEEDKPIQLNISKIGAGEVISYPNGIACGEDCQENYPINYPVELFAVPIDSNVSLKEWQGDCEGKTNHITVIMDANKTCTAVFE